MPVMIAAMSNAKRCVGEPGVAVEIVAFNPDPALLLALARGATQQAERVYVFANSALDDGLMDTLRSVGVEIIEAAHNVGLGEAFNQGARVARQHGMTRLLLLDQDSEIPEGLVSDLSEVMDTLQARGDEPAVIGPRIVAPQGAEYKSPRYFLRRGVKPLPAADPVHYVISSGSLIDLKAYERVGPFRADFFIDAIDTEWCFRAWAKGASCWAAQPPAMAHRIGQGVLRNLGGTAPRQALFRIYAYVRNQNHCLRLAHVPLGWKARIAAHTLRVVLVYWIEAKFSLRFLVSMMQASARGLRGKLGPPPGVENASPA